MKKKDYPLLEPRELECAIADLTGLPFNVIHQTLKAFEEIIKQSIASGVEVKFGKIGRFSWKNKPPRHGVVYYNPYTLKPMEPQDTPGFRIPSLIPSQVWRRELKEVTKFWDNGNEKEDE